MKLSATRLTSMAQAGGKSAIQRAIAVLRKFGTDAHVWLPGVGALNGLTAGNYLDSAGTTAGTVDNPVGLVLDAAGGLGVELVTAPYSGTAQLPYVIATNSISRNGATAHVVGLGVGAVSASKTYRIKLTVSGMSGDSMAIRAGNIGWGAPAKAFKLPSSGEYEFVTKWYDSTPILWLGGSIGTAGQATITNISVREITDIPATQATTANKPILRRGLKNLAFNSHNLSASWYAQNGGVINNATSFTLSTNFASNIGQSLTVGVGATVTAAFVLSGTPGHKVYIAAQDNGGSYPYSARLVTLTSTPTLYHVTRPATTTAACLARVFDSGVATTVTFGGGGLFQGTYTAEEIIAQGGIPVTPTAPASNPTAGKYWWDFDGVDDSLQLSAVPFQMNDDHCVVAGAMNTGGVNLTVFEVSDGGIGRVCSMRMNSGIYNVYWHDGTSNYSPSFSLFGSTEVPLVLSARKTGNALLARRNSASRSAVYAGVFPVYSGCSIGSRANGISEFFNGSIGPVIAIKGTVSDAELLLLEKLVASLSGITL